MSTTQLGITIEPPPLDPSETMMIAQAKSLSITDQTTLEIAARYLTSIKGVRKKIADWFKPLKQAQDAAKSKLLEAERQVDQQYAEAETILKQTTLNYLTEQERLRAEQQRIDQARADQEAIEQKAREVQAAKDAGLNRKEVAAIKREPVYSPPVQTASTVSTKGTGIGAREVWAFEVTNKQALLTFVAANKHFQHLVEPNESAIRQLVNAQKETFAIPGITARKGSSLSARAR